MLTILINAYACSPNLGSEPGMAWNWVVGLANYCKVIVITEGEWENEIENELKIIPQGKNVVFHYNPVSEKVRKMCWNQGDWRFYFYYRKWQKKTFQLATEICKSEKIDIIHQLNIIGYREPGILWTIKNIPTIWGPIGGFGSIPLRFLSLYPKFSAIKQIAKQVINSFQVYSPYIKNAIKNVDVLIACNSIARQTLQKYRKDKVYQISEVGAYPKCFQENKDKCWDDKLKLIWIGKNDPRKALLLAIRIMHNLSHLNVQLDVVGVDPNSLPNNYKTPNIYYHAWLPLKHVYKLLNQSHALLFTSIYEATGTVVLEALSYSVPVLCHDTCGQGDVIDDSCGRKIKMITPKYSVTTFSREIEKLYFDRDLLKSLSHGAIKKSRSFLWEKKIKEMNSIYNTMF